MMGRTKSQRMTFEDGIKFPNERRGQAPDLYAKYDAKYDAKRRVVIFERWVKPKTQRMTLKDRV